MVGAVVQFIGDLVGVFRPLGIQRLVAGRAFFDLSYLCFKLGVRIPAFKGVTFSGRAFQRNGRCGDGVVLWIDLAVATAV